jgi:hypothetical protein
MEDISLWIVIFALLLLLRKKIQPESKHVVIYGWSISAVIVAIFYLMSLNKTGTQKGFSNALWICRSIRREPKRDLVMPFGLVLLGFGFLE